MLLAQLHHKVPSEFEGMEDVLTSSVFGLLKYLPDRVACAFLADLAKIPLQEGSLKLELWPRYPTPLGFRSPAGPAEEDDEPTTRGDTEPDAIIRAGDWLVLMEAKYRSPLDETYNQLGREFAVGYRLAQQKDRQFRLLVVTAHTLQPTPGALDLVTGVRRALEAASAGLGGAAKAMIAAVPDALHWANWQQFYSIFLHASGDKGISENTRRLLEDACQLLALRGLKPYDTRSIVRASVRWESAGLPDGLWRRPLSYRYHLTYSVAAGWEQLLQLDVTALQPLAWRLRIPVSDYDLAAHLKSFQLGSLHPLVWQPFH